MSYEVQHRTLRDGWVNTWTIEQDDGASTPETFATREAAQSAIDQFFAEIEAEIEAGARQPDEGYVRDEFRVAEVTP